MLTYVVLQCCYLSHRSRSTSIHHLQLVSNADCCYLLSYSLLLLSYLFEHLLRWIFNFSVVDICMTYFMLCYEANFVFYALFYSHTLYFSSSSILFRHDGYSSLRFCWVSLRMPSYDPDRDRPDSE